MALSKIKTNSLSDDAVTAAKIATGTIVAADLAANSVDSSELVDGGVDLSHMSVNSIDSDQYVDGSIDLAHLSVNSIDSDQYVDGSIDLAHMSVNSIDSDQYVDGSIDTAHIANDQITAALMADNSIDSDMYVDGSIDLAHMSVNSIDSDQYVDGSIDLAHMSVNSIDSDQYVDGSIDTAHIANDQITAALIADNAIDSDMYVDGSIDTAHIANDQITAALMADNSIDSDMYVDGSIDNAHIADDQIDSEHYAAGSIDLEHMSSQSVDEDNLYISNAGSNGQYLQKQSGNNGGLTWADVTSLAGIDDQSSSNDDQITISDSAVIINEDSDDLDFRVETNASTHGLFVDAGGEKVHMGSGTSVSGGGYTGKLQITGVNDNPAVGLSAFKANDGAAQFVFLKSRNATPGSFTIVQDNDELGSIKFAADDGGDYATQGAQISAKVDGTPGANDMPTELLFNTTADGANGTTTNMKIRSTGNVEVSTGNLVIGTAGKGIDFTASADESGGGSAVTSEVLDEYEEGTWTLAWQDGAGNAATMTHSTGYYTKIGDRVFISGFAGNGSTGSMSGSVKLVTLPFTVKNNDAAYSSANIGYCTSVDCEGAGHNLCFHLKINDTQLEPRVWSGVTGNAVLQTNELSAGAQMGFQGQYVSS